VTSDENTARALARWLEQPPGTEPPSELGRDVVEAVYALRPDLAPTPRLTADDILADVRRGPLASAAVTPSSAGSQEGAEVVAFPGERIEGSESDPGLATGARRRIWWWVGGTGGVGLALVAAATLALIALPGVKQERDQAAILAASPDAANAPAPHPAAELQKEAGAVEGTVGTKGPAVPPAGTAASAPPAPARGRADEDLSSAHTNEVREMVGLGGAAGGLEDSFAPAPIPEVALGRSESNTGASVAAPQDAEKAEAKQKLAFADAAPAGLDEETRDRIDETVKRAERARKKDRQAAATILSEVIAPPADIGQYAAAVAAERVLDEGDPEAAIEIARQGLALSDQDTPERARLEEIESAAMLQQQQPPEPDPK